VRLGASPGYVGAFGDLASELEFAREAERHGYDSVWVGEPYGNDAATVLAWFAGATSRVRLGAAAFAIPGRSPAMMGQTAATLDLISGGRLVIGLGTSGPQVSEGWHGVPFARQLARTREYVEVVRRVLAGERVSFQGETLTLPLPGGEGKPLKLILRPIRPRIPIHLAAIGPRNIGLCGEIADGWLPFWFAPEHGESLLEPLRAGAERAGRDPDELEICPTVFTRVDDDLDRARDLMRPMLALYVGGMGSRRKNFYKRLIAGYGYERVADSVQQAYLAGRKAEAAAMLPNELIDMVCLCGTPDRVAARLTAFREAGADTVIAVPTGVDPADRLEQLRSLAEVAERSGAVDTPVVA
jgi:F420-dependent oxidoreductase-like protein